MFNSIKGNKTPLTPTRNTKITFDQTPSFKVALIGEPISLLMSGFPNLIPVPSSGSTGPRYCKFIII